jgi:hypothetical protein
MRTFIVVAAAAAWLPLATAAQADGPAAKLASPKESPLLKVAADKSTGKIIATLKAPDANGISGRFIYLTQLETGIGSAPVGVDRAAPQGSKLLVFRRLGKKVAAELENPKFVATSGTAAEQSGVRDAFATETLWLGDVIKTLPDGSFTVDLANFLVRDDWGIATALKRGGGGDYKLVVERSAADPASVRVFPRNAEFSARLTFHADTPEDELGNIAPGNGDVTVVQRHSLIALPGPGYVSRHDPYGYSVSTQRVDFSAPLGSAMVSDVASRFRLTKVDPSAPHSRVKEPITFYIDRAAPEPVRSALAQGVGWWSEAFRAAGYDDAFRVEILPKGADPLDVRYNVVNWVNRATRGWSFGSAISDPRTGEIIKGAVLLGSLRVRQDILIYQALVGAGLTNSGGADDPVQVALARIRQLGAHEVGHALGFNHNMAASTQGRYSVMDYPAPRITIKEDKPSLSDAYGVGTGPWDRFLVKWLYAPTDAEAAAIQAQGRAAGLRFVADQDDSRPVGASHSLGALWDDGGDPIAELGRVMAVRRLAIQRFGGAALPIGQSSAGLRRSFVPVWLLHRYQVEAAAKSLGGYDFPYGLNGDGSAVTAVPGYRQQAALAALLATLAPDALAVPERLQSLLSSGFGGNHDRQSDIETIDTAGGPIFDSLKATEVAAVQTLNSLLATDRLNRLELQHQTDPLVPSPHELIDRLLAQSLERGGATAEMRRRIATTVILAIARAQKLPRLSPSLAISIRARLDRLAGELARTRGENADADWARGVATLLHDHDALDRAVADPRNLPQVPPGMPIGGD